MSLSARLRSYAPQGATISFGDVSSRAMNHDINQAADLLDSAHATLRSMVPTNMSHVPDYMPEDFILPIDFTAGEMRRLFAAIAQFEAAAGNPADADKLRVEG